MAETLSSLSAAATEVGSGEACGLSWVQVDLEVEVRNEKEK